MKLSSLALFAVAVAAVLVPQAAAEAAPPPGAALDLEEVYVYETNRQGQRVGPKIKLSKEEREAHRPDAADRAAASGSPPAAKGRRSVVRRPALASASGCRGVDVARVGRSLLGFVTYKFWQHKDWCWSSPSVTGALSHYYLSDVDPNWVWRGLIGAWGDFYNWCCGVWNSGHVGFRQGQFDNCILKYGCIRSEYPWVRIYGHGDGSWSYDTGT